MDEIGRVDSWCIGRWRGGHESEFGGAGCRTAPACISSSHVQDVQDVDSTHAPSTPTRGLHATPSCCSDLGRPRTAASKATATISRASKATVTIFRNDQLRLLAALNLHSAPTIHLRGRHDVHAVQHPSTCRASGSSCARAALTHGRARQLTNAAAQTVLATHWSCARAASKMSCIKHMAATSHGDPHLGQLCACRDSNKLCWQEGCRFAGRPVTALFATGVCRGRDPSKTLVPVRGAFELMLTDHVCDKHALLVTSARVRICSEAC